MSSSDPVATVQRERERRFFMAMAVLIGLTALVGFGYFKLAGLSSFQSPWWVHLHAVSMVGWLGLFLVQNSLVVQGRIAAHRRLGQLGAGYALWIIVLGLVVGWVEVASHRNMPFDPPESLALNWMNILCFAGLFIAAIRHRHRADWHRRLMLCAMIVLAAPAYGRTLIMLDARSNLNFTLFILAYVGLLALGDLVLRRAVHPATLWGLGAAMTMGAMIGVLPRVDGFAALALGIAGRG